MRRGSLALTLQHALVPSPLSKRNFNSSCTKSFPSFRNSAAARHLPSCELRWSRSSSRSSSSSVFDFATASSRHCSGISGDHGGRSSPSCLKSWRRSTSEQHFIWRAKDLGNGRLGARGCRARAALATMASATGGRPEGYRPNVGLCLVNEKNEVFVASRLDIPGSWQMPQGGVDDGEEPKNAAIRELREETGVTSVQLIGEVHEWLTYDFPPDVRTKITKLWGREWTGQAQKWFLFRFHGDDSEVNLDGDGTEPAEFGKWKWLPADEVLKEAVEFKRPVYAEAFKSLAVYIDSWSQL